MKLLSGLLFLVLSTAIGLADDDPLGAFPKPTAEIEVFVKTATDPAAAAADKAKAWMELQNHAHEGATTALAILLRDDNAKTAQAAAEALKKRDKAKVREVVLAALGAVPPEKWGMPSDRDEWRATGLTKIVVDRDSAGSATRTTNVQDKNKKFVSAKIEVATPGGNVVTGVSDKEITPALSQQVTRLCTKHDTKLKALASKSDGSLTLFEAPPANDRRLMQLGLGVLSTDDAGRKAAAVWKKDYAARAVTTFKRKE